MEEEIDEFELLPFRVLAETGSAKFVAKERFIHRQSEPRFFVHQLSAQHEEYGRGYRFAVQLLDEAGRAGAVLSFRELDEDFQVQAFYVPASVIAAAKRQSLGQGDYVDEAGYSRRPF